MKIAYIITGLGVGGAETITVDIANQMFRRGNQVLIVYLTGENHFTNDIAQGIEVTGLQMKKNLMGLVKSMLRARKILRNFKPDVVHAQMVHANLFARILRLFVKMPRLICTEHSNNIEGKIRMLAYQITDPLSDLNTNVSRQAVEYFIQKKSFLARKSQVIYNGIDLSKYRPDKLKGEMIRTEYSIAKDDFLFINVSRLTTAKDHFNLLQAFSLLENGKLIIVGGGDMHDKLVLQAKELGVAQRIIFAGTQRNISDLYNAADCFVLSSAWEGFGLVLAEAMACGLPVITTDAGGCAEVVANPYWVVPIKDHNSLSAKMNEILNMSTEQRQELGEKNIELSRQFDIDEICNQWSKIYSSGLSTD